MFKICPICNEHEMITHLKQCVYCYDRRTERKLKTKTYYIYALIDPRNSRIRYIGITYAPRRRLRGHISAAKTLPGKNPIKAKWINDLISKGHEPQMVIIQTCSYEASRSVERQWVHLMLNHGADLLNNDRSCNCP